MKKLVILLLLPLIVCCSKDDDGGGGLDDPNKPLSEKLASMTSPEGWLFEIYNETRKSYNAWYFFQDGNLMNTRSVTDNWSNDTDGRKCKADWYDHKLDEITILNDTPNTVVWDSAGGRTYSLVLNDNTITYKRNNYVYATATLITKAQLDDFQSKYSTYPDCP